MGFLSLEVFFMDLFSNFFWVLLSTARRIASRVEHALLITSYSLRHHTCMSAPSSLEWSALVLYLHLCRKVEAARLNGHASCRHPTPLIMRPRFAHCALVRLFRLPSHHLRRPGASPQTNSSLDFFLSHSNFSSILFCSSCRPTLATQERSALVWAP